MKKQTNAKMPAIKIAEHEQMIPTWEGVLRIYLMALVNKTERWRKHRERGEGTVQNGPRGGWL